MDGVGEVDHVCYLYQHVYTVAPTAIILSYTFNNEHSTANYHIVRLQQQESPLVHVSSTFRSYMYRNGHNVTLIPTFQSSIPYCDRLQSESSPVHVFDIVLRYNQGINIDTCILP